jgi:hypothetical protein
MIVIEQKKLSGFDKWSNINKLKSSFPMTYLGQFGIRRQRYDIEEVKLWRLPEHEFLVRDYFRKYNISMDMMPNNFYDLALLKKYEKHCEIKLPENMSLLCGDEYMKFMDMTDDLMDFIRFYKIL